MREYCIFTKSHLSSTHSQLKVIGLPFEFSEILKGQPDRLETRVFSLVVVVEGVTSVSK